MTSADLTRANTVRELVSAFRDAEQMVRTTFATIVATEKRLNLVFTLGGDGPIRIQAGRHANSTDFADPDGTIERMTRRAWGVIVERLELQRMVSMAKWREIEEHLNRGELPAITQENIEAFASGYLNELPQMISEAVDEVFNWLRPPSSRYKTNTELEIGPKVILSNLVEGRPFGPGFRVSYYRQQHLTALENVFNALDGRGNIAKTYYSALQTAIEAGARGETPLFRFKAFRNGNVHLTFLRLDLLDRLNKMAGGKRLRPVDGYPDPIPDEAALVVSRMP